MRWTYQPLPAETVEALSKGAGVSRVLAELLLRAGVDAPEACATFLQPPLAALNDPFLLHNLDVAATRLRQAIARRESLVVLGDYDVDGVSSTALLVSVLRRFDLQPRFIVPRRSEDGYGLSRSAIDRALEAGRPDLFIVLDCGTNSHDEVAYLRSLGFDYNEMEASGVMVAVVDAHVRYRAGARYDDELRIVTRLDELGSRSMRFGYELWRDETLVATGIDLCSAAIVELFSRMERIGSRSRTAVSRSMPVKPIAASPHTLMQSLSGAASLAPSASPSP